MRAACTSTILIRCLFHLSRFSVGRCGPLASASGLSFHLLYRFVSSRTWTLIKPDHPVCPFYRYRGLQLAVRSLNAPVYLPFSTGGRLHYGTPPLPLLRRPCECQVTGRPCFTLVNTPVPHSYRRTGNSLENHAGQDPGIGDPSCPGSVVSHHLELKRPRLPTRVIRENRIVLPSESTISCKI